MNQDYLDLLRQVLDRQLVDANNLPCGKVDDLEIEGGPGEELKVTAILVGPGAWSDRLPDLLRLIVQKFFSSETIRIPWEEVSVITTKIKLNSRADEVGLGRMDSKAARLISRLPGA